MPTKTHKPLLDEGILAFITLERFAKIDQSSVYGRCRNALIVLIEAGIRKPRDIRRQEEWLIPPKNPADLTLREFLEVYDSRMLQGRYNIGKKTYEALARVFQEAGLQIRP